MPEPDLTAELDAAEEIVMGRAETVEVEWGSREISPDPASEVFWYHTLSERTVRRVLASRARRGRRDVLYRRTVTIGPPEEVPGDSPDTPAECPESKMDDGTHATDYEDSGSCPWCGERNPDWREVPGAH